jgi:hypothetical protein
MSQHMHCRQSRSPGAVDMFRDLAPGETAAFSDIVSGFLQDEKALQDLQRHGMSGEGSNCMLFALLYATNPNMRLATGSVPFRQLATQQQKTSAAANYRKFLLKSLEGLPGEWTSEARGRLEQGLSLEVSHLSAISRLLQLNIFVIELAQTRQGDRCQSIVSVTCAAPPVVAEHKCIVMHARCQFAVTDLRPFGGDNIECDASGHIEAVEERSGITVWDMQSAVSQVCTAVHTTLSI